jgi:hypothetical protein
MDILILGLLKAAEDGIGLDAAFKKFSEQVDEVTANEFKERVEALKAQDFIIDKSEGQEDPLLYPSEKTLRIQTI